MKNNYTDLYGNKLIKQYENWTKEQKANDQYRRYLKYEKMNLDIIKEEYERRVNGKFKIKIKRYL